MVNDDLLDGMEFALAVAKHAHENNAKMVKVLDLRGISSIADFFVICNASSIPQLKALRRDIDKDIQNAYLVSPRAIEGSPESLWLVLDYVDVVVHIFHNDLRETYSLEELWSDAKDLNLEFSTNE